MSLSDLIETQNPWWRDPRIRPPAPLRRRTVFGRLRAILTESGLTRAQVLLGPRQVGKTTLLLQVAGQFLDDGWPAANVLYFDFKDDRYNHTHGLRDVLEAQPASRRTDHPRLLLLDEVTQAPRWDVALKQLVDEGRTAPDHLRDRVLVTDSAAALARHGAQESLQGRVDSIRIHGLTFEEALRIQGAGHETERDVLLRLPAALERYLERGGLPEHLTTEPADRAWERIRRDVIDSAIARDLSRENQVDIERVSALYRHIVQQSGSLFEASNRARDLQAPGEKGPDARTVRRWVDLLEQACLVERLSSWHPGLRRGSQKASRALRATPKLYAEDHGLIPAFSPIARPMDSGDVRGRVYETAVFTHLRALRDERGGFQLYYFRERDREVDFVLAFEDAVLGVEVTASKSPEKKLPGLLKAAQRAELDRAIVVHGGPKPPQESDTWAAWPLNSFLLDPAAPIDASLECLRKSR